MSVTTLAPAESARAAHRELQEALLKLAEAQVALGRAIQTVAMFERNFDLGFYSLSGSVMATGTSHNVPYPAERVDEGICICGHLATDHASSPDLDQGLRTLCEVPNCDCLLFRDRQEQDPKS